MIRDDQGLPIVHLHQEAFAELFIKTGTHHLSR